MTAHRARACGLAILLAALASRSLAQPAADAGEAPPAVVLIELPALASETQGELREALLAQFALLHVEPRIETESDDAAGTSLGERMSDAQKRGKELGAMAVFWIDAQPDGRWFLHMMDAESERILVRPVDAAGVRRAAAIEAVAVMVRESTRALLEGAEVMDPLAVEALPEGVGQPAEPPSRTEAEREAKPATEPPTKPPAQPNAETSPKDAPFGMWLGYHLDQFGSDRGLQDGATLGLSWLGLDPFTLGATVTVGRTVTVEDMTLTFDLDRVPIGVSGGFRLRFASAAVELQAGGLLEILEKDEPEPTATFTVENPQSSTELLFGVAGRLRGELFAAPTVAFFATVGLDVIVNHFKYISRVSGPVPRDVTVLRILPVRPVAELGIAFYP